MRNKADKSILSMSIKKNTPSTETAQLQLFLDVQHLIEETRNSVSQTVNAGLTVLYWNIGKRINEAVLENERAAYGKKIITTLSKQLVAEYGGSYKEKVYVELCNFTKFIRILKLSHH